jgi:hypothetical protein
MLDMTSGSTDIWYSETYAFNRVRVYEGGIITDIQVESMGRIGYFEYRKMISDMESGSNPTAINPYGYMGLYQFGEQTLRGLGSDVTLQKFRKNGLAVFPVKEQHRLFKKFTLMNENYLKDLILEYDGKIINGVRLTRAGILAGAHLVGCGSAKRVLMNKGKVDIRDGNGVSFFDYASKFSHIGYILIE